MNWSWRIPRAVAAQKLQSWLLATTMVALLVTGLLVLDLTRNLHTVVTGEARRAMENALSELLHVPFPPGEVLPEKDQALKQLSYEVLRSYLDVEGGYLWENSVVGHSFPSYTEPGSDLGQPPLEHRLVLAARDESRRTGQVAGSITEDGDDVLLVLVHAKSDSPLSAWTIRRLINFSNSSEVQQRLLLLGVMLVALIAVGTVLRLSFSLQRGFSDLQTGLIRLRGDPSFRLPSQNEELRPVVEAVNEMAESRQRLEAELRREDRLRLMGRIVAGIAHEIRNPLNSMRLTARVLERRLKDQDQAAQSSQLIIQEIDRLNTLLNSLLAFQPDEPVKTFRQPLAPILERATALVEAHARDNAVEIITEANPDLNAEVNGDHLQQALINLLLNAIDASRNRGPVCVQAHQLAGGAEIAIRDSGTGFSAEQMERQYEAFYTTKPGGTGLGLAVTKALLDRMGAQIECESSPNGTCFRIHFPNPEKPS